MRHALLKIAETIFGIPASEAEVRLHVGDGAQQVPTKDSGSSATIIVTAAGIVDGVVLGGPLSR